jgi:hypothetical protein
MKAKTGKINKDANWTLTSGYEKPLLRYFEKPNPPYLCGKSDSSGQFLPELCKPFSRGVV